MDNERCGHCYGLIAVKDLVCPNCGHRIPRERNGLGIVAALSAGIAVSLLAFSLLPTADDSITDTDAGLTGRQQQNEVRREELAAYFKSDAEDLALEALWTNNTRFVIGVLGNGRRFDDYANYVCSVLSNRDFGAMEDLTVKIVDLPAVRENGDWTAIGEASCNPQSVTIQDASRESLPEIYGPYSP